MGGDFPACIYWRVKRNPWESVKVAGAQWACRGWHPVRQTGATKQVAHMTGRPWDHITTASKLKPNLFLVIRQGRRKTL